MAICEYCGARIDKYFNNGEKKWVMGDSITTACGICCPTFNVMINEDV